MDNYSVQNRVHRRFWRLHVAVLQDPFQRGGEEPAEKRVVLAAAHNLHLQRFLEHITAPASVRAENDRGTRRNANIL
jgi:hypothetical protein